MDIVNAFLEKQLIPCLFSVAVSIGILILTVMAVKLLIYILQNFKDGYKADE